MKKNKIAALVCAAIAALLVIMAGKSCTKSAMEANEKSRRKNNDTTSYSGESGDKVVEGTTPTEESERVTDIFGRIVTSEAVTDTYHAAETTTEPVVEYVTDAFGNVIGTETVTSTTATTNDNETETTATTTLNPLEQFKNDQKKPPPNISGFNHGNFDEDGNPKPTLPPDFSIVIN